MSALSKRANAIKSILSFTASPPIICEPNILPLFLSATIFIHIDLLAGKDLSFIFLQVEINFFFPFFSLFLYFSFLVSPYFFLLFCCFPFFLPVFFFFLLFFLPFIFLSRTSFLKCFYHLKTNKTRTCNYTCKSIFCRIVNFHSVSIISYQKYTILLIDTFDIRNLLFRQ